MAERAVAQQFEQPIVGYFDPSILIQDEDEEKADGEGAKKKGKANGSDSSSVGSGSAGAATAGHDNLEILGAAKHHIDFSKDSVESLQNVTIPFDFKLKATSIMHGVACWFDVTFAGEGPPVVLSTAPNQAGTHWYQCRLLLQDPIAVNRRQHIKGQLKMDANDASSFDLTLDAQLVGTDIKTTQRSKLQDQNYHYMYK